MIEVDSPHGRLWSIFWGFYRWACSHGMKGYCCQHTKVVKRNQAHLISHQVHVCFFAIQSLKIFWSILQQWEIRLQCLEEDVEWLNTKPILFFFQGWGWMCPLDKSQDNYQVLDNSNESVWFLVQFVCHNLECFVKEGLIFHGIELTGRSIIVLKKNCL